MSTAQGKASFDSKHVKMSCSDRITHVTTARGHRSSSTIRRKRIQRFSTTRGAASPIDVDKKSRPALPWLKRPCFPFYTQHKPGSGMGTRKNQSTKNSHSYPYNCSLQFKCLRNFSGKVTTPISLSEAPLIKDEGSILPRLCGYVWEVQMHQLSKFLHMPTNSTV